MSYLFGPVPSRRLGLSLGIDLVPFKTCSFDCIYCQLGRTTEKTIKRGCYVDPDLVLKEIEQKLKNDNRIDYLTLSGSGEPTLYTETGKLIKEIKKLTDKPVAVLTNGSLLWDDEVSKGIMGADLVIPSLDAGDENTLQQINRPCNELSFKKIVDGLVKFSKLYKGETWLEVFLLDGINSEISDATEISDIAEKINPDKIQLNTVKRPPAESSALPLPEAKMKKLAKVFKNETEIIADFKSPVNSSAFSANRDDILNLLKRRPCSIADISAGLGLHRNEVLKYTEELLKTGAITTFQKENALYYLAT